MQIYALRCVFRLYPSRCAKGRAVTCVRWNAFPIKIQNVFAAWWIRKDDHITSRHLAVYVDYLIISAVTGLSLRCYRVITIRDRSRFARRQTHGLERFPFIPMAFLDVERSRRSYLCGPRVGHPTHRNREHEQRLAQNEPGPKARVLQLISRSTQW